MSKAILSTVLLLSTSTLTFSQKTMKMYDQVLKAKEILGQNTEWGPKSAEKKTEFFNIPNVVTDLHELLGSYYTTINFYETKKLLNLVLDEDLTILDSIDFRFYSAFSFLNILDGNFRNDDQYEEFKSKFKNGKTLSEKRSILYHSDNEKFRIALQMSKYGIYRKKIKINQTTKISKDFKFGLKAEVVAVIEEIVKLNANLKTAIQDSIEIYAQVENAYYHEIRLRDEYLKYAQLILLGVSKDNNFIAKYPDIFSVEFLAYLKNSNAAIITGAAVFEATFNLTRFSKLITSIEAVIKANLEIADDETLPKIKAELESKFLFDKERNVKIETASSFYYARYCYATGLELGEGSQ